LQKQTPTKGKKRLIFFYLKKNPLVSETVEENIAGKEEKQ
jgi:hypothetical protein